MGSQSDLRFPCLPCTTVASARIWEVLIDLRVKLTPGKNLGITGFPMNLQILKNRLIYRISLWNTPWNFLIWDLMWDWLEVSCWTERHRSVYTKVLREPLFCISSNLIHWVSRLSVSLVCHPIPSPRILHLPVESSVVHSWVTGLKLPGFELLAFSMGSELYLHCPLTQLRHRFSLGSVAELIGLHPPGLSKVIHIKLEVSISTN